MSRIEGMSLADSAREHLRGLVLSGELEPGTQLSVAALAARLGISRSPVREAVLGLIHDGLAESTPNAAAKVIRLDDDRMRDVLRVRAVLDGLAAEEAATRLDSAQVAELWEMVEDQGRDLAREPDTARDTASDVAFHSYIRECSGNATLIEELDRLEARAHLHRGSMWNLSANRRAAHREHTAIVEALESGNPNAARTAAEEHVRGVLVRMRRG
ncbi:GntR family transcriptional regulator [Nocardiopsis ganjiahuensis]|uniref:GntR family transcriptional regulator n=1 Tax=Nocardiopsis ganjiahuensis TaxID=239984 RepID=UPI000685213E|nr:GntR family transcriptional regulator [Nocardiopsis ganjiahuensis]